MNDTLRKLFADYTGACVKYGATDCGSDAEAAASEAMTRLGKELWAALESVPADNPTPEVQR
jgi:hypothetical protein